MKIFLYGPPGSGKTRIGRRLAESLNRAFLDLDAAIERSAGRSIPEIFASEGEAGFRAREKAALEAALSGDAEVIALGGGALLDTENRLRVTAAGRVVCLWARPETLLERLRSSESVRPLVGNSQAGSHTAARLYELLEQRAAHYDSFQIQVEAEGPVEKIAWEVQLRLGLFHLRAMGHPYDAWVASGGLDALGEQFASRGLRGPLVVVSDENVGPLYGKRVIDSLEAAGYQAGQHIIPAGEMHKTAATVQDLWAVFLEQGVERGSTVIALGGGVVGDLAGFAAATYLRGIDWVGLPTSLLAMVDASLGGKTGADLPQGKNLVGAFHPPRLVLADPGVLATLPKPELHSGLAEVVKAGVIGDPALFELCAQGWEAVLGRLEEVVRRAMGVKVKVIEADPYEKGFRAALNLGHTVGHAVELVSGFRLRHGEAVAIGMVSEARIAEEMGLAEPGLAGRLKDVLTGLGLPSEIPQDLDREAILNTMQVDKKRSGGRVRFALPVAVGEVRIGVELEGQDNLLR